MFRRGDVVVSLYAFPTNYQSDVTPAVALASTIDAQLAPLIASVCVNENAPLSASRRNPTQSDYRPYTTPIILTPPAKLTRPDLNLLNAPLPVVVPPPRGSITSPPTPPVVPTVALTATIGEPAKDTVGPGCGWAFTAMAAPPVASSALPLSVRKAAALARLEKSWTQWPTTVTAYLQAQALYLRDLASYTATIATTTTTTTTTTTIPTTTTTTNQSTTTTTAAASPPG
jgi:hypothetical protein